MCSVITERIDFFAAKVKHGSVTMTTEVGTDGATTLSRMNLSVYVGHVTIFSSMFTIACCLVVGLGLGSGLGLDLVSGW